MAARDVIFIAVTIFVLGIAFYATHYAINNSIDKMLNITQINGTSETVDAFESTKTLTNRLDYIVLAVFIGLILALIISSWFIGGNPIFMFIYALIVIIGVILSAVLANAWETYSTTPALASTITSFPITNHLLSYLPIYAAVIGFIGIVVMFAKPFVANQE